MFAIIKNKEIIWFSDVKVTEENMVFDKIIEWSFDTQKKYIFIDDKIIDTSQIDKKSELIEKARDLAKQWEDLRIKYLSVDLLPDSESKTEKLQILHERGQSVLWEYLQLEWEMIAEYGMEILQDLV
jgi:hypothetical protein